MTRPIKQAIIGAVFAATLGVLLLGTCQRRAGGADIQQYNSESESYTKLAESTTDPFQACAAQALAGKWGPLQAWQERWYRYGLERGLTCKGRAKVTSYGPFESPKMSGGPYCWVSGRRVRLNAAHCAANPEIPRGSIIWTPYGLRFVVDRGGWVKLGYVPGVGQTTCPTESANLDYWGQRELPTLRNAPYVVLRRGW